MPCCAIITCRANSQFSSIERGNVSFHRFPAKRKVREQWISVTGRENWMPTKCSTICSKHFNENDFIIKKSGNRYIKPEAIPTEKIVHIYTSSQSNNSCNASSTEKYNKDAIAATTSEQNFINIQDLQDSKPKEISLNTNFLIPQTKETSQEKSTEDSLTSLNTTKPTENEKRMLRSIIVSNEYLIEEQRLRIIKIQTQNRKLKKKVIKTEKMLNDLKKKCSQQNEDFISVLSETNKKIQDLTKRVVATNAERGQSREEIPCSSS